MHVHAHDDLITSLLAGLDRDEQVGLLERLEQAREEQLRAKRAAGPAD